MGIMRIMRAMGVMRVTGEIAVWGALRRRSNRFCIKKTIITGCTGFLIDYIIMWGVLPLNIEGDFGIKQKMRNFVPRFD